MSATSASPGMNVVEKPENELDIQKIESITVAYLRGELSLPEYQQELERIDARIDLRRLASGLGYS